MSSDSMDVPRDLGVAEENSRTSKFVWTTEFEFEASACQ